MNCDFFLVHRAHQIQRLRTATTDPRIDLSDSQGRWRLPRELSDFVKSVDTICKLPIVDGPKSGMLNKLSDLAHRFVGKSNQSDAGGDASLLTEPQRALLMDFERNLVRLRLSEDSDTAEEAGRVMRAILVDHEFFDGLKPLPEHPEEFAYEMLFPTWFNLYTAMIRELAGGEPRFSVERQRPVFRFLSDWLKVAPTHESKILSAMTFIVNRFPPPDSYKLMQRLMDLSYDEKAKQAKANLRKLWEAMEILPTAADLKRCTRDALVVQSCLFPQTVQKAYDVALVEILRPSVPVAVVKQLERYGETSSDISKYFSFIRKVCTVVERGGGFAPELAKLLNENARQLDGLFRLLVWGDDSDCALSLPGQVLLVDIIRQEKAADVAQLKPLVQKVLARMDGFSESTKRLFRADFIHKAGNRKAILRSCQSDERRRQLAAQLVPMAKKSGDDVRLLDLVSLAAAVAPDLNQAELEQTHLCINVLQAAQTDGSIGRTEMGDLIADLKENLPASLTYLGHPIQTATRKSGRLAGLYLALNEECEQFRRLGKVSNFGLTRAGYRRLGKLVGDEGS